MCGGKTVTDYLAFGSSLICGDKTVTGSLQGQEIFTKKTRVLYQIICC